MTTSVLYSASWAPLDATQGGCVAARIDGATASEVAAWFGQTFLMDSPSAVTTYLRNAISRPVVVPADLIDYSTTREGVLTITATGTARLSDPEVFSAMADNWARVIEAQEADAARIERKARTAASRDAELSASPFPLGRL